MTETPQPTPTTNPEQNRALNTELTQNLAETQEVFDATTLAWEALLNRHSAPPASSEGKYDPNALAA